MTDEKTPGQRARQSEITEAWLDYRMGKVGRHFDSEEAIEKLIRADERARLAAMVPPMTMTAERDAHIRAPDAWFPCRSEVLAELDETRRALAEARERPPTAPAPWADRYDHAAWEAVAEGAAADERARLRELCPPGPIVLWDMPHAVSAVGALRAALAAEREAHEATRDRLSGASAFGEALSACRVDLTAARAEVERLTRERDEAITAFRDATRLRSEIQTARIKAEDERDAAKERLRATVEGVRDERDETTVIVAERDALRAKLAALVEAAAVTVEQFTDYTTNDDGDRVLDSPCGCRDEREHDPDCSIGPLTAALEAARG